MDKSLLLSRLESRKRKTGKGLEYWMARDLQPVLGYSRGENFVNVIEKAKMAFESAGVHANDQFRDVTKGIMAGKGAELVDYYLSCYAWYLIAMNRDPGKSEIGQAQTHFAVQTRRPEVQDQNPERRIELRQRVKEANRNLNSAAKGVQNYGLFHDAGYRGLYGMGLTDLKAHKRIPPKEDLLDRAGRIELAANEFRITQAEDKLRREKGQSAAINTHRDIGQAVRTTIQNLGGKLPEDLPPEPSIKRLSAKSRATAAMSGQKQSLALPEAHGPRTTVED